MPAAAVASIGLPSYLAEAAIAKAASVTIRVSTKGRVTLPKAVRLKHNWPAGTELVLKETPEGVLLKAAPVFPPTRFEDVVGMLRGGSGAGRFPSTEEMDEAVRAEGRRRARD